MIREQSVRRKEISRESRAYRDGWEDGRFGTSEVFDPDADLSGWENLERLAYYRGHQEGRRIREMLQGTAQFS